MTLIASQVTNSFIFRLLTPPQPTRERPVVARREAVTGDAAQRVLVVLGREETNAWLSLRNLPEVHLLHADQLNTYDVLVSDRVVFTSAAYESFVARVGAKEDEER